MHAQKEITQGAPSDLDKLLSKHPLGTQDPCVLVQYPRVPHERVLLPQRPLGILDPSILEPLPASDPNGREKLATKAPATKVASPKPKGERSLNNDMATVGVATKRPPAGNGGGSQGVNRGLLGVPRNCGRRHHLRMPTNPGVAADREIDRGDAWV